MSLMKALWSRVVSCYDDTMFRMACLFLLSALPALADEPHRDAAAAECYCTGSRGERIELGETICLKVGGRDFLAQCQMSLNVPMWRDLRTGCVTSFRDDPVNPAQHPLQSRAVDAHI